MSKNKLFLMFVLSAMILGAKTQAIKVLSNGNVGIGTNNPSQKLHVKGIELMSFPIMQAGFNTFMLYASALPAGMYLYTLAVDNVIIDSKRIILTK
ncbi:MAG: hypothetical protein LBL13_11240 [Bacteroidales bacterium]|jgi:hypothetical protein|nr:hypothetical protein [Bacteroidales bacterium]